MLFRSADIVASLAGGQGKVVIENQFGKSDHPHLGKALTYAADLGATAVIWVAEQFTDNHRKTIDWLNQLAITKLQLFAVEIRLWRIGDSPAAPQFIVVSQPDDSARVIRDEQSPEPRGAPRLYLDFWTQFREHMVSNNSPIRVPRPASQGWISIAVGRSGFGVNPGLSVQKGSISCELYMSGPTANRAFLLLEQQKEEIEAALGAADWQPLPEGNDCRIAVYRTDVDLKRREDWPTHFAWLQERCESFVPVFRPRVKALELDTRDETDAMVTTPEVES